MNSSEKGDVLRLPRYDHRWWVGVGPFLVATVAVTWMFAAGAASAVEWFGLVLFLTLASVPAMVCLAYTLDDARRGYRYTRELEGHLFMVIPWAFSLLLLAGAGGIARISEAQLVVAVGLLAAASLPALLSAIARNHRNRVLPYRNPRDLS